MDIVDCFGNVVGLTHDSQTDSGLYITDLEALSTIDGLTAEDGKSLNAILEDARRVAILALHSDLMALLNEYAYIRKPYVGRIGTTRWTYKSGVGASLVIVCRPLENATLTINQIGVNFRTSGVKQVTFSSNTGLSETYEVNAVAGEISVLDLTDTANAYSPLVLPLYSNVVETVNYTFSHNEPHYVAKLQPCGSCSFRFHPSRPKFTTHGLTSYVNIGGYDGSRYINSSAGLVFAGSVKCKTDNIICDGSLDFEHDAVAHMYAQAIQYKAGSVVVWSCLRNSNLNRVLMEDSDDLREAAKYYERKYRDMVGYIATHAHYSHDCVCEKRKSWIGKIR